MSFLSSLQFPREKFNRRIASMVARYTFQDIFRSLGSYVLLSLGWAGVYLSIGNTLEVIRDDYASVVREPLSLPVLGMLVISSLFFSIIAGISFVRDRELGIVEVLFYGPITHLEYIVGKFLAHWSVYAILTFVFMLGAWILADIAQLTTSLYLVWLYAFSLALSAAMIVIGQLLAVLTRSVRGTVFVFSGIVIVFLFIQLGSNILSSVVQMENNLNLIGLRDTLAVASSAISWLSPIAIYLKGVEALVINNWSEVILQGFWLWIYFMVLLAAIVAIHSRREIMP